MISNQHNVLHAYNRYRKRSRVAINRPINARNTAVKEQNQQRHRNFFKKTGDDEAASSNNADEHTEEASTTASAPAAVGVHTRMHLDAGLVRNTIFEVVGTEPFNDHFVGRVMIDAASGGSSVWFVCIYT